MTELTYRKEKETKNINKIKELLSQLPKFVTTYNNDSYSHTEESSRLAYIQDIKLFFEYVADSENIKSIMEITPEILENLSVDYLNNYFFSYLKMYEKNGEIHQNNKVSINRKISSIRSLYNYLYETDKITNNPALKVKVAPVKDKNIVRMDDDEAKAFLDAVENGSNYTGQKDKYHKKYAFRDTALLSLILGTGIRVSECAGLNINDVDLKNHRIKVIRKGNKEDIVYISDEITEIIRDYIYAYRKTLVPVEGHEDALFLSSQRKRISVRSIERLVEKYAEDCGLSGTKHITVHSLRKTFGSRLFEATSDLYLVAETLGHKSVNTTKKHYADITNQHKEKSRNALKLKGE